MGIFLSLNESYSMVNIGKTTQICPHWKYYPVNNYQATLSCREFPVVLVKSYEIDTFIMDYHVYKTA